MNVIISRLFFLACLVLLSACASHKPVVYPDAHSKAVGTAQIERDIADCKALAESAGASSSNSKATNVAKQTGRSGGVGAAAGFIHRLFAGSSPNPTYRNFVTRSMTDRGYDLAGWD